MPFERDALQRVLGEGVLLAGGGRALLLQVAHPAVAAGVVAHSGYRRDRVGRLLRTLRPMYALAFGTPAQVAAAAAGVRAAHERVVGPGYRASDPALLAWVLATLIDSALVVHARCLGPLPGPLAERYYQQLCALGGLLGMPRAALPANRAGFARYFATMVRSLEVGPEAHVIAAELFAPLPGSGPALLLAREVTAALLPAPLRRAYGLPWDPARAAALEAACALSRVLLPRLPVALRRPPPLLMPPRRDTARAGACR
jgi:uncharacterized protein (DUF2236 family)